jgi:hypothetical protein
VWVPDVDRASGQRLRRRDHAGIAACSRLTLALGDLCGVVVRLLRVRPRGRNDDVALPLPLPGVEADRDPGVAPRARDSPPSTSPASPRADGESPVPIRAADAPAARTAAGTRRIADASAEFGSACLGVYREPLRQRCRSRRRPSDNGGSRCQYRRAIRSVSAPSRNPVTSSNRAVTESGLKDVGSPRYGTAFKPCGSPVTTRVIDTSAVPTGQRTNRNILVEGPLIQLKRRGDR